MKKFYSVKIKHRKENIPPRLAEQMLLDESKMIKYLWRNQALEFKYPKGKNRLDVYADEKYLMMAKMKYPNIFGRKGRMGFLELYISHTINKKLQLGTWQGIYLYEHRNHNHERKVIVNVIGE